MKLHKRKIILWMAAAAMTASPLTSLAASSSSLVDQLNRTSSFYAGLSGSNTASPYTISSTVNSSTRTNTSTTGSSSGPGGSSASGTVSANTGVVLENSSSKNSSTNTGSGSLPSRKIVSLTEQYYEDYDQYEEGIDGLFYFYTNIGNGQLTDQSVYLDFPANLSYTAELDGQTFEYQNKQPLTTYGTYVFRITAVYTPDQALSEQTEYQTTFRFRIQAKVPKKQTENDVTSAAEKSDSGYVWNTDSSSSLPLVEQADDVAEALASKSLPLAYIRKSIKEGSITLQQMADMLGVTSNALQEYLDLTASEEETEAETTAAETEVETDEADTAETAPTEVTEDALADAEKSAGTAAGRGTGAGLLETVDKTTGQYLETLFTGSSFSSSVQNGATVNGSVMLRFTADSTLNVQITRNGEDYPYQAGDEISESGWYCVNIEDTQSGYEAAYEGKEKPRFYFQIINEPVNNLEMLFVPKGETVKSFTWNGKQQNDYGSWVTLPYDGSYELTYTTASGEDATVEIERDTRKPQLTINIKNGRASFSTDGGSEDRMAVYRNGELLESLPDGTVSGAGNYEVHVTDTAGNTTVATFTLKRSISGATIIAVLLLIALSGGMAGYVVWVKRNTSMH